jgi:hypothetical protein
MRGRVSNADSSIEVISLVEFFRRTLKVAAHARALSLGENTEYYIVRLLCGFSHRDTWLDSSLEGQSRAPLLAILLMQALESSSVREQEAKLQRLGDIALFTAGFFAQSFSRKLVDVDYYAAMGGNAYQTLAESARTPGLKAIRPVFAELSAKFVPVMDTLNELAENNQPGSSQDVLRSYEIFLKTGSARARDKLQEAGIDPLPQTSTVSRH